MEILLIYTMENSMKIVEQSVKLMDELDEVYVLRRLEEVARTSYKSEAKNIDNNIDITKKFIKRIINMNHLGILEHVIVSFRLVANRAILNELVRHRIGASYVQTSTRYYKWGEDIEVIRPYNIVPDSKLDDMWKAGMKVAEFTYHSLLKEGLKPQHARDALPLALASEIVVTMNLRAWLHYFELRTASAAHPQIRELSNSILKILTEKLPTIFTK